MTHPDLHVELARAETFRDAVRFGFSQADARDMSEAAARRVERERKDLAAESDWISRSMLEARVR